MHSRGANFNPCRARIDSGQGCAIQWFNSSPRYPKASRHRRKHWCYKVKIKDAFWRSLFTICPFWQWICRYKANALRTGVSCFSKDQIPLKTSTKHTSHNTGSNILSTLISEHIQAISAMFFMLIFPFLLFLVMSQQLGLKPLTFITEEKCRRHSGKVDGKTLIIC